MIAGASRSRFFSARPFDIKPFQESGVELVNSSKTTSFLVNVGAGYNYVKGTIDPGFNTGLPVSTVTLQPRSGLLLVKQ